MSIPLFPKLVELLHLCPLNFRSDRHVAPSLIPPSLLLPENRLWEPRRLSTLSEVSHVWAACSVGKPENGDSALSERVVNERNGDNTPPRPTETEQHLSNLVTTQEAELGSCQVEIDRLQAIVKRQADEIKAQGTALEMAVAVNERLKLRVKSLEQLAIKLGQERRSEVVSNNIVSSLASDCDETDGGGVSR